MAAVHKAMTAPDGPGSAIPHHLTRLAEICREAGAAAATVIYCRDKVVVFYKDPHTPGPREDPHEGGSFDELHILNRKNACILIAVFPESTG